MCFPISYIFINIFVNIIYYIIIFLFQLLAISSLYLLVYPVHIRNIHNCLQYLLLYAFLMVLNHFEGTKAAAARKTETIVQSLFGS